MSRIEELPNNANNYLRKGYNALDNNDVALALYNFEQSFLSDSNETAFEEIINLSLSTNNIITLQKYWNLYMPTFSPKIIIENDILLNLWIDSTPYLYTKEICIQHLNQLILLSKKQSIDNELLINLREEIFNEISIINSLKNYDSSQFDNYITTIHSENPYKLLKTIKLIYQENDNYFDTFLIKILDKKEIENYIKNDVLHYLLFKNLNSKITYYWFDQKKEIEISTLIPYYDQNIYRDSIEVITEYFSQNDPHLTESAITQFNLHALSIYPFLDEILVDKYNWLNTFKKMYFDSNYNNDNHSNLEQCIVLANQELQNIFINPN